MHTYFALVARLIAIEVLALSLGDRDAEPSLWASEGDDALQKRLRAIDAGEVPATLRIANLFEGDVFSWYLDSLTGTATFSTRCVMCSAASACSRSRA